MPVPAFLSKIHKVKTKIITSIIVGIVAAFAFTKMGTQAASSPWTQTDWSGGTSASVITDTVTTYASSTNIDTATTGQISLAGSAIAKLQGNQLSNSSTDYNVGSKTALQFNLTQNYNDDIFTYAGGDPTKLTVDADGDYFISLTMPINSSATGTGNRNAVEAEIRVNGSKADYGVARSSYIRNSSQEQASNHLAVLLDGLTAGDEIEIYVARATSYTTNTLTGTFTVYAEKIDSTETIFAATGTQTTSGTDLNSTEASMQWDSENVKDSGYTHSTVTDSHLITLDDAGNYFVTVNIPMGNTTVQRANLLAQVKVDGTTVDGGIFQNGYIRSADSHFDGSIHWAGLVQTASSSQDLSITVQQEAKSGSVTTDSEKATIFIQKLPDNGIYQAEATTVGGGTNWNPAKATIDWATDNIIDTDVYTHDTGSSNDEITVDVDGDYLVAFNAAFTGAATRGNPIMSIQVNGSDVTGAEAKTGYIRNADGHQSASDTIVFPLYGLSANDVITLSMDREGATTAVNDDTPGTVLIMKKGYAASGTLTSNVFNAEFGANWGNLTYTESGTGTVSIKVRTDTSSDMSGATDWSSCTAISSGVDMSANSCVTDGHQYVQYQVTLQPSSGQTPVLEDITLAFAASDSTAPTTNATSVAITDVTSGTWTNAEPTITWTAGADNGGGSGILGYCISLDEGTIGVSSSLDPELAGGALNALDDGVDYGHVSCPFVVTTNSIDLSAVSGLTLTSNKQYYFSIKAVDNAGNVWTGVSGQYQDLVSFKFDNTPPTNVSYISTPSQSFGSVDDMFFNWPSSGGSAASDAESGLIGWQYSLNNTSNYTGDSTEPSLGISYIYNDGSTSDFTFSDAVDGSNMVVGDNLIYFRAVDAAGNFSTPVSGGIAYGGNAPSWTGGEVVTITPSTNTSNSFGLAWSAANAGSGLTIQSYYYMINVSPPSTLATLESNSTRYIPTTATSIATGKLTGAVKGSNTVYVVAVDSDDNYSPSNAISGSFTLNSTNPDPVQNLTATDASIKDSELWRATLNWSVPSYQGNGDLTYIIQRSTDNSTWSQVSTTTGLSYTDTVSTSSLFYYRVGVYDSSDDSTNNPTYSTSVSITPKGTFDEAPELSSDPTVTGLTTKKATITWSTSRDADTKVQYGKSKGDYFDEEPSKSEQVTAHTIELTNLDPGTTYYFKAKWTDEDGNTGISDEITFKTDPRPEISEASAKSIGVDNALLEFTSKNAEKVKIYYGETTAFGGLTEITTGTAEQTNTVRLDGLTDGTKYFYKINTFDSENEEYEGDTNSFTTLPRPRISNVRVQQVRGAAQPTVLITWTTNTDISSIVTYYPAGNPAGARDEVNVERKQDHRMIIRGLLPQTRYTLTASGRDIVGNEATSEVQTFTTATDTRPPAISNLKVEGSIAPTSDGGTPQAQLVVSWDTDEEASSQIEFGEGTGTAYAQKTQEDTNRTFNHLVVISGLTPSKVYHLRAVSKDEAGNIAQSVDTVRITPKATGNALDLVISNLSEAFGFLGSLR